MGQFQLSALALYGAGAFLSLAAALVVLMVGRGRHAAIGVPKDIPRPDAEVYILSADKVTQSNFRANRKLEEYRDSPDIETRLKRRLLASFSDSGRILSKAADEGDLQAVSRCGSLQLLREVAGDEVRLEISSRHVANPDSRDLHNLAAENEELRILRANTRHAPFLLWRQNADGEVTWANRCYVDTARDAFGHDRVAEWPLPALFPNLRKSPDAKGDPLRRVQASAAQDADQLWFDCHTSVIDGDLVCTAFRADEAVRSEKRRREFTQTLTKTFADLSIGLAIFDRSRRLVLFNPALSDLTSLQTDFLTSRPSLFSFLDQLRENRVMPEPRDYRAWRQALVELEAAAAKGTYSETWSLPDGQTYRVSGRPHPDGAVALLFEDISAEMSLTRRFRADLESSQSVIEALDDAVAVFSGDGRLTVTNAAYRALWRVSQTDGPVTALDASRRWHELAAPTPVWGDFREFATQSRERSEWSAQIALRDGRSVACRFVPQRAGATLAIFRPVNSEVMATDPLRHAV